MENIKVGDLVIVVKPTTCCGFIGDVGKVFTVLDIDGGIGIPSECWNCGQVSDSIDAAERDNYWHEIKTLKKIPPLSELDKIETKEELPCKV